MSPEEEAAQVWATDGSFVGPRQVEVGFEYGIFRHSAFDPALKTGWITPDGVFYRCGRTSHDSMLWYLLGMYVVDAEVAGWVRVSTGAPYGDGADDGDDPVPSIMVWHEKGFEHAVLTREQMARLVQEDIPVPANLVDGAERGWGGTICPKCNGFLNYCLVCNGRAWVRD